MANHRCYLNLLNRLPELLANVLCLLLVMECKVLHRLLKQFAINRRTLTRLILDSNHHGSEVLLQCRIDIACDRCLLGIFE